MKRILLIILAITLCLPIFSSCKQESNEGNPPPPLSSLSEYSEEQLNEMLSAYTMYDIHAAWGAPERHNGANDVTITLHMDMYNIPNTDKSIVIDYNDDVKVNRVRLFDLNKWVDYEN